MTSAILAQRSYQLSYQANWKLVNCDLHLLKMYFPQYVYTSFIYSYDSDFLTY